MRKCHYSLGGEREWIFKTVLLFIMKLDQVMGELEEEMSGGANVESWLGEKKRVQHLTPSFIIYIPYVWNFPVFETLKNMRALTSQRHWSYHTELIQTGHLCFCLFLPSVPLADCWLRILGFPKSPILMVGGPASLLQLPVLPCSCYPLVSLSVCLLPPNGYRNERISLCEWCPDIACLNALLKRPMLTRAAEDDARQSRCRTSTLTVPLDRKQNVLL